MDGVLQIVLKTGFFGKIDHFPPLFQQFLPMDPKILNRPIKWPHLYHFKVYESSNKPIVGVLMEIQMPHNEFKNSKFNNPHIDNQMSGTCGLYEPLFSTLFPFFLNTLYLQCGIELYNI